MPPKQRSLRSSRATGRLGKEEAVVTKLFVGNLPWTATDAELQDLFSEFGEVHSARVIVDRDTGRSKGFAFVELDDENAKQVLAQADAFELGGRPLRVNQAEDRRPRGGGGGGGGGGGNGGGRSVPPGPVAREEYGPDEAPF
jgi:RNA recognition motif-containing protein